MQLGTALNSFLKHENQNLESLEKKTFFVESGNYIQQ